MSTNGLQVYLTEAEKHQKKYLSELNELRKDLLDDNFRSRDYRAVERVLQIFTGLCISLAKHWFKTIKAESASDAYQTFSSLREHNLISNKELINWRKIIYPWSFEMVWFMII